MFQHKDMRGSLFQNDKKTDDKQPDYKGSGTIDGLPVWISGWKQRSQKGTQYLSLSFSYPVQAASAVQSQLESKSEPVQFPEDDLPF